MMEASRARSRRSRAKEPSERKRPIYVPLACQACRRKKLRCDGCSPCAACQARSTDCLYEAAIETRRQHGFSRAVKSDTAREPSNEASANESRHKQLERTRSSSPLSYNYALEALGSTLASFHKRISVLEQQSQPAALPEPPCLPERPPVNAEIDHMSKQHFTAVEEKRTGSVFAGPTSANFSFQVADRMLRGKIGRLDSSDMTGEDEIEVCVSPEDDAIRENTSPQTEITLPEAVRLIRVYSDVMNSLHPILDMAAIIEQAKALYAAGGSVGQPANPETCHLMMVLAIALLAEEGPCCSTALAIYQRIKPLIADVSLNQSFTLCGQTLLILTVFFHMFHDNFRLGTRVVAVACRIAIEAGLHRKHVILRRFPESNERKKVVILMYTLTIIDRQLNFNSGLPITMRDTELDIPISDDLPPYVKAMARYVDFGAQAWAAVLDGRGRLKRQFEEDNYQFLSYQVQQWQESLPEQLQPHHDLISPAPEASSVTGPDYATVAVRCMLYLRANQIKILILRPLLFSAQSARTKPARVLELGHIARDSIDRIVEFDQRTDLCRKQWPILNQFLSSALSTLLLLYIHLLHGLQLQATEPAQIDKEIVGRGIKDGINLLKKAKSQSCQRLWERMSSSFGILTRLGLDAGDGLSTRAYDDDLPDISTTGDRVHIDEDHQLELHSGESLPDTGRYDLSNIQSSDPTANNIRDSMHLEEDLFEYFRLAGETYFDDLNTEAMCMPLMPNDFDDLL